MQNLNSPHQAAGPLNLWTRMADRMEDWIGHDLLAVVARAALAVVFFMSGRTKVTEGTLLTVSDNAYFLFAEEYKLPWVPSELAAVMATYAEHLFPLLLVLGLFTRLSALGLLGMTAVIQLLVYPGAWPTHLLWLAPSLYLVGRGGGALSLDRVLGIR